MFLLKKPSGVKWIIVFLGNPGSKYLNTRHNAGFMTADALEKSMGIQINRIKFNALTAQAVVGGEPTLLMKPQTFMNLSGTAAKQAMDFYKVPLDHLLVVSDDIAMPVGKLRIRRSGSAGGHNGLKDIIAKCGGDAFPRLKIGVGAPPNPNYDVADWVLSVFRNQDAEDMEKATKLAAEALSDIIALGIDTAMCKYN